jgi:hypothetical protein
LGSSGIRGIRGIRGAGARASEPTKPSSNASPHGWLPVLQPTYATAPVSRATRSSTIYRTSMMPTSPTSDSCISAGAL